MKQVRVESNGKIITVGRGNWNKLAHQGMVRIETSRYVVHPGSSGHIEHLTAKQCRRLAEALNKLAYEIDEHEEVFNF